MGTDLVKPSKVTVATSDGNNFATKHGDFSWNLAAINRDLVEIYTLVDIQKTMENDCYSWANQLFLWPFSIAMLVYQRVPVMETSLENMQNITANFGERLGRKLNFDEFRTV